MSAAAIPARQADEAGLADPDYSGAEPAIRRVLDAMTRAGVPFSLKPLPEQCHTPEEIAEACDCDLDFIAQTTIFRGMTSKKPLLLLHSAASKVSDKTLGAIVGENLQRADGEFVRRLTGYPPAVVPPLAHLNRLAVVLDSALLRFARVWVSSGTENAVISVPTMVLARAISARVVRLDA